MSFRSARRRCAVVLGLAALVLFGPLTWAGPYVTPTSGIRWNDVGGIRWNDVGGIRWNDVGGIRWNDVGGIEWSDASGFVSHASGIRWNDVGGIRWNDVGSLVFDPVNSVGKSLDLELLDTLSVLPDSSAVEVIITYGGMPTALDLNRLVLAGILGGEIFHHLPMVVVNATKGQIRQIAGFPNVRSIYSNKTLGILDVESAALIGALEIATDVQLRSPAGHSVTGAGVTIAVLDSGVDATHPDLPWGTKVVENVRLSGLLSSNPGFVYAPAIEGTHDTDLVLGHGTAVASVAAGTGAASAGHYAGIAPGAKILGLSTGDLVILDMLEGFDYILESAARFNVRVVNCSWGTTGWFDADDPINIATRLLYDAGIVVVFAAGNYGPAPDTLNPYSVAPWVVGVGSVRKDGKLSSFSSRGIYEEILYHPALVAPGEAIVTARTGALGGNPPSDAPGGAYTIESGTSFSAPHVAGVVAEMLEAAPALTPTQIRQILQSTATPMLGRDRSEVGAGRLDAWAAVARAVDPARAFGTHVPGWLDQRPFRIEHHGAVQDTYTLAPGTTLTIPAAVEGTENAWQLNLAWGTVPGIADLDVKLVNGSGDEVARSDSLNAAGLFGRAEGIDLLGDVPAGMAVEVSFKPGSDLFSQEFLLAQEGSSAVLTAYSDTPLLAPLQLAVVTRAVSRGLMVGRGGVFAASAAMTRAELARALALTAGAPQRIPSTPSFADAPVSDAFFPYIESIAGRRARTIWMGPPAALPQVRPSLQLRTASSTDAPAGFQPSVPVRRIDFAIAMVRAAGKQAEAERRAGELLAVADRNTVPRALAGYVAVALEQGFIGTVPLGSAAYFNPTGTVARLEASQRLLTLLAALGH